jgi:hypothetical protein
LDDTATIEAEKTYHDARLKFDYFVTGGAGATLAYLLQAYTPGTAPQERAFLFIGSTLLLICLGAGLLYLRSHVRSLALALDRAELTRHYLVLREAHREGHAAFVSALNESVSGDALIAIADSVAAALETRKSSTTRESRKQWWLGALRDTTLFLGFLALAFWRGANL